MEFVNPHFFILQFDAVAVLKRWVDLDGAEHYQCWAFWNSGHSEQVLQTATLLLTKDGRDVEREDLLTHKALHWIEEEADSLINSK